MGKSLIYRIIGNRDKILEIAKRNGVENVRVFGSVSRKQDKSTSDIDLLVDVATKPDGTEGDYISFALDMQSEIFRHKPVQVCTPETLHPRFKEKVLKNCISIMEDNPQDIDHKQIDERDYVVNVEKAQKAIKHFWEIIALGKEKFLTDRSTQSEVSREMQIAVEELVRAFPNKIKFKIKDINWHKLKKFRNFLVHNYDNVVWRTMWKVSQEQIKEAEKACKRILEVLDEDKK